MLEDPDGEPHEITADYLLGCDGSSGISRTAIGARYEGSSGTLPNLSITFRSRALEERPLCALGVHYWVIGARHGGLMGRLDLDGTWWAIVQGIDDDPRGRRRGRRWSGRWSATTSTSRCWPPTRGRPACCWSTATAASGCSWSATPRTSTRRGAATASTPASATRSTSAGSWPPCCRAGRRRRCWTATRPSAVRWPSAPSRAAGGQEAFLAPSFAAAELDADGPAGEALRAEVARALQVKDPEFHSLGLVLGYDYPDSPVVVPDGSRPEPEQPVTTFEPSAHPGARLPHVWLPDGTLGLRPARRRLHAAPARARRPTPTPLPRGRGPARRSRCACSTSRTCRGCARCTSADLVLVRPDQHVAWRGADVDRPERPAPPRRRRRRRPNVAAPTPSPLEEIAR